MGKWYVVGWSVVGGSVVDGFNKTLLELISSYLAGILQP